MYGERWRYREGSGTGARDAQSESLSFAQSCRYHKVGKMKVNQKPGSAPDLPPPMYPHPELGCGCDEWS